MMKTLRFFILLFVFFGVTTAVNAQGSAGGPECESAVAFCTADLNQPFNNCFSGSPNSSECATSGQGGVNYGCLGSTPFPTWYFLQIDTPGDLNFEIVQNTSIQDDGTPNGTGLDVDFAIWGPFSDTNVCGGLGAPIDCSFSGDFVENASILNAQQGEVYVFLVTNFSGSQGEIFITQTNANTGNPGTTDCSIVEAALGPDQEVCEGEIITLDATEATAVDYDWSVDTGAGFNPIPGTDGMPTIEVTTSGNYMVVITDAMGDTGSDEVLVTFFENPLPASPMDLFECDGVDNDGFATFDLESQITTILNGQSATDFNVTFHLSQAAADAGTGALTGTGAYNSMTDVIFVRVENNSLTDCADTSIQFNINVETLPIAVSPMDFELCDNDIDGSDINGEVEFDLSTQTATILDGQDPTQFIVTYHISIADADTNTAPLPDLYTNVTNPQTIFARVENNLFTGCFSTAPLVLQVNALPALSTPVLLSQCDTDVDGFAPFNLTEAETLLSVNSANETFEYTDAGGTVIPDPTNYTNPTAVNSFVIVTVTNADGCSRMGRIDLEVTASQIPAGTLFEFDACDTDGDNITEFDFSIATSQFEALFPQPVTVTYFETQAEAEAELNPIDDISTYSNDPTLTDDTTGIQLIWVRIDGNANNDCVGLGTHIELTVNPNPTFFEDITPLEICSPVANVSTFDLTEKDLEITGGNPVFEVTYYASLADFTAINPIVDPVTFTNTDNPQTIFYSLENTVTGCTTFDEAMNFDVIVNQTPILTVPTDLQVCDEDGVDDGFTTIDLSEKDIEITGGFDVNLTVTYHLDLAGAVANDASIPDLTMFVNTINPQIVVARVSDNTTGCFSTQSLQVEVFSIPVPIAPALPYEICDDDNDGISSAFVLSSRDAEITGGDTTLTVAYYLTMEDAENAPVGGELDPLMFTNNDPFNQTVYARVFNAAGCFGVTSLDLVVLDTPMPNPDPTPFMLCDDDADGLQVFDLLTQEMNILGDLDPTVFSIQWFPSLVAAENGAPTITTPTSHTSNTAIVYAVVTNTVQSTTTFCSTIVPLSLVVNPLPIPIQPAPFEICDDEASGSDTDELSTFDLSSRDDEITGGDPDLIVTYHLTQLDADTGTPVLPNFYENTTTASQTIFARVENVITNCFSTTTLTLVVNPLPSPTIIAPLEECDTTENDGDDDNDGDAIFDLTGQVTTDIINGEAFVELAFFETLGEAEIGSPEIVDPSAYETSSRIIYVRANDTDPTTATECFRIIELELIVQPLPILSQESFEEQICVEFGNNGTFSLDLITLADTVGILSTPQVTSDFNISYHVLETQAETGVAALGSPHIIADGETLYVRIENTITGCFNTTSILFDIFSRPEIFEADDIVQCADDLGVNVTPDQDEATFDLTQQDVIITGGTADVSVNYYTSLADAQAMENEIEDPGVFVNTTNPQTIYAITINTDEGMCESIDVIDFEISVQPLPYTDLTNEGGLICVDEITGQVLSTFIIDGTVENPQIGVVYTYVWTRDGALVSTEATVEINAGGTYQVLITAVYPDGTECDYVGEVVYVEESAPVFEATVLEGSFNRGGLYTVEVTVTDGANPDSIYEFAIDNPNGPYQSSTTFTDVRPGDHTIYGRLANGNCTMTSVEISIIDFPRFFTPNSDGVHDTWNIIGLDVAPNLNARIFIFDRYGKLLKQISPQGPGWDGTFNGQPMPSSDYWFRVEFTEIDELATQRTVNGHFTLKR